MKGLYLPASPGLMTPLLGRIIGIGSAVFNITGASTITTGLPLTKSASLFSTPLAGASSPATLPTSDSPSPAFPNAAHPNLFVCRTPLPRHLTCPNGLLASKQTNVPRPTLLPFSASSVNPWPRDSPPNPSGPETAEKGDKWHDECRKEDVEQDVAGRIALAEGNAKGVRGDDWRATEVPSRLISPTPLSQNEAKQNNYAARGRKFNSSGYGERQTDRGGALNQRFLLLGEAGGGVCANTRNLAAILARKDSVSTVAKTPTKATFTSMSVPITTAMQADKIINQKIMDGTQPALRCKVVMKWNPPTQPGFLKKAKHSNKSIAESREADRGGNHSCSTLINKKQPGHSPSSSEEYREQPNEREDERSESVLYEALGSDMRPDPRISPAFSGAACCTRVTGRGMDSMEGRQRGAS